MLSIQVVQKTLQKKLIDFIFTKIHHIIYYVTHRGQFMLSHIATESSPPHMVQ